MDRKCAVRGVLPHIARPAFVFISVSGGGLLNLQKLSLDGAHPGHQAIEFRKKLLLVVLRLFNEIRGSAMTNAQKGIRERSVQKPHMVLQIQEFLVKLGLLEHGRGLT